MRQISISLFVLFALNISYAQPRVEVVGGEKVDISEMPWNVYLESTLSTSNSSMLGSACTGSYLGGKWVITAAHCVSDHPEASVITAHFGVTDKCKDFGLTLHASKVYIHPGYERYSENYQNHDDIALIELETVPPPNYPNIQAIEYGPYIPGYDITFSGWGKIENDAITCTLHKGVYNSNSIHISDGFIEIISSNQATVNKGDSGGPNVIFEDHKPFPTLVGVSASKAGERTSTAINVNYYDDWIKNVMSAKTNGIEISKLNISSIVQGLGWFSLLYIASDAAYMHFNDIWKIFANGPVNQSVNINTPDPDIRRILRRSSIVRPQGCPEAQMQPLVRGGN